VACSGATTKDIIGDNKDYSGQNNRLGIGGLAMGDSDINLAKTFARYNFVQGRIYQETFVSWYDPKVITIGVGGNDVDLVGKLKACIGIDTCDYAGDSNKKAQVANEIKSFYPRLVETYKKLHSDSPSSKIFAIGYPRMIQEDGYCDISLRKLLDYDEREFMNEAILYLNQVTEAAAKTAGIKYFWQSGFVRNR
jgi:lysophospholipase L1-like esterase